MKARSALVMARWMTQRPGLCVLAGILVSAMLLYYTQYPRSRHAGGSYDAKNDDTLTSGLRFTPGDTHIREAFAQGLIPEIDESLRLDNYLMYRPFDLFTEDMPKIVESWRQQYKSDVFDVLSEISKPEYLANFRNPCYYDEEKELRCLPHFMIIGVQKCGTTDLYDKMQIHPHVSRAKNKEPFWWNRQRMSGTGWGKYLNVFAAASREILDSTTQHSNNASVFHPVVTGEGTAGTIWDSHNWMSLPENEGFTDPVNLTANTINKYLPDARFILIIREPTNRLYSDYYFFAGSLYTPSPEDFDARVRYAITWLSQCFKTLSRRHCLFDPTARNLEEISRNYMIGTHFDPVARLRLGLYSEYLAEWNAVFPAEQTLVIRLEDYSKDRLAGLNAIYRHIGLEPLDDSFNDVLASMDVKNVKGKHKQAAMLPSTKTLLDNFYHYFNVKLVTMLHNDALLYAA